MGSNLHEYNILTRFVMSVVIFGHFHEPCVAQNKTIEEFICDKTATDGRVIVLISDHKTGAQGPTQVALEPHHHKLFALYACRPVH